MKTMNINTNLGLVSTSPNTGDAGRLCHSSGISMS